MQQFKRPERKSKDVDAISREVHAVETTEITPWVKDPVHRRLLTTWPVQDLQNAQEIIEWFTCRWMTVEIFKVPRKEYQNIEDSELEHAGQYENYA